MGKLVAVLILFALYSIQTTSAEVEVSTDSSQQKFERKALFQIADVGIERRRFSLPVTYCPYKKICIPFATWSFDIDQSLEDIATRQVMQQLSGNRYDSVSLQSDKLIISTTQQTIEVDSDIGNFRFDTGPYGKFVDKTSNFLNGKLAVTMKSLLIKAKDARYQELPDREKETFLSEVAKEISVPVAFLDRLLNSAFVFATYMEAPRGRVRIEQEQGRKGFSYSVGVDIDLPLRLVVYRYNAELEKFELQSEIRVRSGYVSDDAEVFPVRPSNITKIAHLFPRSFTVAAKAAGLAADLKLKEDDNFAIFSTVDQVDEGFFRTRIASAIGENEDLRVDAPYIVKQMIDGEMVKTGVVKARKVAERELLQNGKKGEYYSQFSLIKGDVEYKDQLREHPWSGVLWFFDGVGIHQEVEAIGVDDNASGGGDFYGIGLGTRIDLGYALNAHGLSESWLEIIGQIGLGGQEIVSTELSYVYTFPVLGLARLDYTKRMHLGASGLYLAYKFGIAASQITASPDTTDEADNISIVSGGLGFGLQTGYLFTPNAEFFINAHGFLPFAAEYRFGDSTTYYDARMSMAYGISVGLSFHMKSIGGLAGLVR